MRDSIHHRDEPAIQQRTARRLLAKMDRCEDFAEKWENFDAHYPDLPGWEAACQRENFANTYRRLIGVPPIARDTLRGALREVADFGAGHVPEILAEINRRTQMNRSASGSALSDSDSSSDSGLL